MVIFSRPQDCAGWLTPVPITSGGGKRACDRPPAGGHPGRLPRLPECRPACVGRLTRCPWYETRSTTSRRDGSSRVRWPDAAATADDVAHVSARGTLVYTVAPSFAPPPRPQCIYNVCRRMPKAEGKRLRRGAADRHVAVRQRANCRAGDFVVVVVVVFVPSGNTVRIGARSLETRAYFSSPSPCGLPGR